MFNFLFGRKPAPPDPKAGSDLETPKRRHTTLPLSSSRFVTPPASQLMRPTASQPRRPTSAQVMPPPASQPTPWPVAQSMARPNSQFVPARGLSMPSRDNLSRMNYQDQPHLSITDTTSYDSPNTQYQAQAFGDMSPGSQSMSSDSGSSRDTAPSPIYHHSESPSQGHHDSLQLPPPRPRELLGCCDNQVTRQQDDRTIRSIASSDEAPTRFASYTASESYNQVKQGVQQQLELLDSPTPRTAIQQVEHPIKQQVARFNSPSQSPIDFRRVHKLKFRFGIPILNVSQNYTETTAQSIPTPKDSSSAYYINRNGATPHVNQAHNTVPSQMPWATSRQYVFSFDLGL